MIETILFILAVIIVFYILHKITKSLIIFKVVFRLVSVALILIFAVVLVIGLLVLDDANNFRNKFPTSTNLFLLEENNTILSAIEMNNSGNTPYSIINQSALANIEDDYNHNRISRIETGYYKVFVVDTKAFQDIEYTQITDKNIDLSKQQVLQVLRSQDPKHELADIISGNDQLLSKQVQSQMNGMDNNGLKGYLFSYALSYFFNPKNLDGFLAELKNGNILVYEETAMFKAIRIVPDFLVKNTLMNQANTLMNGTNIINPTVSVT
jgi:hypothetical protein